MAPTPRKILVATDFSTTADSAERLAYYLAVELGAELHVLHVRVILEDPLMAEEKQLEIQRLMASADAATREAFERAHGAARELTVETHLVRSLSAAEAIAESATELGCDLVVMGTHGRRGIKHLLLGSVAENVVRSVRVPVLTVRPGVEVGEAGVKRILVPFDFSDRSAAAVRVAGAWADVFGAEITLLHVVEPVVYPEFYSINVVSDDVMTRLRDRATEALDASATDLLANRPVSTTVLIGRAADTIVTEAQPANYDLVVMGTRGLSGLEHIVLGSVVEGVLRRCPVPLLTVGGD
ncbi:MAG: universal stress protein [Thermoanaerobaculales bacterium]|jgi:nucleotide-binding universal stress UspA family protein|nr:universal stress protein [Thermoanaerobaculales bacterium]